MLPSSRDVPAEPQPDLPVRVPAKCGDVYVPVVMDLADAQALADAKTSLSIGSHGYAQMWWDGHVTLFHRWLLGLERGNKLIGDHINGDSLDNRRINLRAVTPSGSSQNVGGRGCSRFRGVHRMGRKWQARVKFQGRIYGLGVFESEAEAGAAADQMRRELMPDYAGQRTAEPGRYKADTRNWTDRMARQAELSDIRAWAKAEGLDVSDVGRMPKAILAAYRDRLDGAA